MSGDYNHGLLDQADAFGFGFNLVDGNACNICPNTKAALARRPMD